MADLIIFLIPFGLLILGYLFGHAAELNHLKSLQRREESCREIPVTDLRVYLPQANPGRGAEMVVSEVVIATDYMKTFLASIRKIIGGEMRSYNSLLARARREAVMRLIEQAREKGHNAVCNVRMETSIIGGAASNVAMTIGVIASGTAYTVAAP